MNKDVVNILKTRNIHPTIYRKINSVWVINNYYVIKLNTNNYDIYKYLLSRDFPFFPINYNNPDDNYDISLYLDNLSLNNEQKIIDYIKLISLLHKKTGYKREIDLDEIKEKYEYLNNKINSLRKYYLELNDAIDHHVFLSPSEYLLVKNISLIYNVLNDSEIILNNIYQEIKNNKSIRVALLHNNIDLDHLLINDNKYLISWDKSYFDSPIYEIEKIYRKYYNLIELKDLLSIYESINKLSNIEKKYLLVLLAIPKEILLTNNTYHDTIIISDEINYLNRVYDLLIKNVNKM